MTDIRKPGRLKQAGYDASIEVPWKKGDIIRAKQSAHPYLVIHIYIYTCTLLVDLEDDAPLTTPLVLLPKNYDNYTLDRNMEINARYDGFEYNPITL